MHVAKFPQTLIKWNSFLRELAYSGTPPNGHPSTADTHDITDNSESPDCPSIHFNT